MEMEVSGRKGAAAMADSVSLSSTEDYDVSCQPCSFEGNNVAAEGYCQTCSEYLCKTCLSVHRKQSATRNHIILGKGQMPKVQTKSRDVCTKPCSVHVQEIVKYYCKSHDVVGCGDCMVLDHKTCKVDLVANVSSMATKDENEVRHQFDQFQRDIEKTKESLKSSEQDIAVTYAKISQDIAEFRKEINKTLDNMEAQLILQVKKAKTDSESVILEMSTELQELENDLKRLSGDVKSNPGKCSDLFVSLKESKAKMSYLKMSHAHLKNKNRIRLFEFERNGNITKLLSDNTVLGTLRSQQHKPQESKKIPAPQMSENIFETKSSYVGKIEIKNRTEKDNRISGISVLSADELVIADNRYKNVKLINLRNNEIKDTLPLEAAAFDITCIDTTHAVVTLPSKSLIKFISASNSVLTEQSEISVSGECYGISHYSDGFVVSFCRPEKVEMIDTQGNVLRSLVSDPSGERLFAKPRYVDICQSSKMIYVSDREKEEVIVLTSEGKLISRYKERIRPEGLFVLNDGKYLVAIYVGDISVISRECIKQKTVVAKEDSLKWTTAICYSYEHKKLFVGTDNGKFINVYQLQ